MMRKRRGLETKKRKFEAEVDDEGVLRYVESKDSEPAPVNLSAGSDLRLEKYLDRRAKAFAACGHCSLLAFRGYNKTLLDFFYMEVVEAGLRANTVAELVAADRRGLKLAFEMAVARKDEFDLSKALLWAAEKELPRWLGPRPQTVSTGAERGSGKVFFPPPPPPPLNDFSRGARGGKPDKGKGKGKSKGKEQRTWPASWAKISANNLGFCFDYHLKGSCEKEWCKYTHRCPVLVNGRPCGASHSAQKHDQASNR